MRAPGKEMYKFLMVKFVQQYINPKYMGQDAVFVHLFEKFINTGEAEFFSKEYKDHMTKARLQPDGQSAWAARRQYENGGYRQQTRRTL